MISSPLKCQIIPQSQEYKHITQSWTFQPDRSNLHAYPNISELCQQTKSKSSQLPSSSPKALTKVPSVPKMAEHLLSFPWILSSHLQTSTWNIVPVAETKNQVSAGGGQGDTCTLQPLGAGHIPSCHVCPQACDAPPMQEGWAVQHKALNCQEVAPLVHQVAPR